MTDKPKKQTFRMLTDSIKANALAFVALLPVGEDWEIECRVRRLTRRQEQNSLYWVWLGSFAEQTGHSKDELHAQFKRRFLLRILLRDNEQVRSTARLIREHGDDGHREWLVDSISTTRLSVAQFAEYLTDVERFMIDKGYTIPPDPRATNGAA